MPVSLSEAIAAARAQLNAAYTEKRHVALADFVEATVNFKLHDWQKNYLCPILERCQTEKGLRLAIHGPPQYGKSVIVSQRLPAYLVGCDPTHRVGLACYNETHATGFGEVIKSIIQTDDYRKLFPSSSVRSDAPAGRFSTSARTALNDAQPSFLAMGLMSGFTGKGVDTLIIDDPYKSAEEATSSVINEKVWRWWSQTASVRVGEEANVIVMFHRYHDDDFAQRLIDQGFEYVRFPAIADENEDGSDPTGREPGELLSPMRSLEWLEAQKEKDLYTYLGQFQGIPRQPEGAFFQRDWFKIIDEAPKLKHWVRGWDLATSVKEDADHTVGAKVGIDDEGAIVIADVNMFRLEWPDAADEIIATAKSDGSTTPVAVEKVGMQLALLQSLARDEFFEYVETERDALREAATRRKRTAVLTGVPVKGDKKQNASVWARAGKRSGIKLVAGDWNTKFLNACLSYRGLDTDWDDPIDAVSRAYHLAKQLPHGTETEYEEINDRDPFLDWAKERKRRAKASERRIFTS